jgi:5-methyltetrahydropteroyltriglutamate--homocysteine methyltransferase
MSDQRILTTHTGSLPRPRSLLELYAARDVEPLPDALRQAVARVVERQAAVGIDIVNDGEFGKPTDTAEDDDHGHGVWAMYVRDRLAGFEWVPTEKPRLFSKDRADFPLYYGAASRRQPAEPGRAGEAGSMTDVWTCTGPISYRGQALVERDIANLQAALSASGATDAFLPVVSPASIPHLIPNAYYATEEEYELALADALREEYKAIAAAGFIVHVDDPVLVVRWDTSETYDRDAYLAAARRNVEVVNYTLEGIPTDRMRYHMCWGSWDGPHRSDVPLADVVDLLLEVRAGAYLLEAANPRHEHEWRVWQEADLPEDRLLVPGVVTHKTPVVEHPEVVADRIMRYASAVGRDRVIAGTDCGLGGRISSDIAWAKLESLVEGARLASDRLRVGGEATI